jgi:uncharacterized protein
MEFEWDVTKADLNLRNHGIAFEVATRVFLDLYRIEEDDPYPDEDRQRAIGLVDGRMLLLFSPCEMTFEDHLGEAR